MARAFDDASNQYLRRDSSPISGLPLTISAWFNTDSTGTTADRIVSLGTSTDADAQFSIRIGSGQLLIASHHDGTTGTGAIANSSYTTDVWQHGCAVFDATNSKRCDLNGVQGNESVSVASDITPNRMSVGAEYDTGTSRYLSGYVAEVGVWNVGLTFAETKILSLGYSPLLVRPESLVAYLPLLGRTSPEIDLVGGYDLTLINSPTTVEHPRVISYPVPDLSYIGIPGKISGVEEVHRFRFNDNDPVATFRTFIRTSTDWADSYTPTRAYEVSIANTGGYTINRIESGSRTLIGSGPWVADTNWWWIKFQAVGKQIRFKMWRDGQGEPVAWMNDINDNLSGFTIAGRMQLALRTGA